MNSKIKGIIRRALKNGFDLSTIRNYNPKLFSEKLYLHLVEKKYFCFSEEGIILVSDFTFEDLAELEVHEHHLKITPLKTEGIFSLLLEIFTFIADNPDLKPEDEETTEDYPEDDSKEFDWI